MTAPKVVHFVNSFVDRPGNIGKRTARILERQSPGGACICRGSESQVPGTTYFEMSLLGHVPRILNGIRIHLAPSFDHRPLDIFIFEQFALWKARKLIRDKQIDIAHVWDICPNLIKLLKDNNIPVIQDVPIAPTSFGERLYHEQNIDFLRSSARLRSIEKRAFKGADLFLAPSAFVANELKLRGISEQQITIVEFGVDLQNNKPSSILHSKKEGLDFCFMGNVNRRKGVSELLEAWSGGEFSRDRLHLCGRVNADVTPSLSSALDNVILPGFVSSFDYLSKCDIFVLPSWMEGSAKAVYEAMSCGLPTIVTPNTGSIVRDGIDGFVIEAGDVSALKKKMLWFKENPEKISEFGQAAIGRVKEFSWGRYAERVNKFYNEAIDAPRI